MRKKINHIVSELEQKGKFKLAKELSNTNATPKKAVSKKDLRSFQKILSLEAKKIDTKIMKFVNEQRKAIGRKPYPEKIDYYTSFVPHAESIDVYRGIKDLILHPDED
jgi:hypothetical protein